MLGVVAVRSFGAVLLQSARFVGLTTSRGLVCCWALRVSGSPVVLHGRLRLRHARLKAGASVLHWVAAHGASREPWVNLESVA